MSTDGAHAARSSRATALCLYLMTHIAGALTIVWWDSVGLVKALHWSIMPGSELFLLLTACETLAALFGKPIALGVLAYALQCGTLYWSTPGELLLSGVALPVVGAWMTFRVEPRSHICRVPIWVYRGLVLISNSYVLAMIMYNASHADSFMSPFRGEVR